MNKVSAQVSLYPLRQPHIGPAIERVVKVLRDREGLDVQTGTMSTLIGGEFDQVFDGLKEAFRAAASSGDVVMVVTLSSACPSSQEADQS